MDKPASTYSFTAEAAIDVQRFLDECRKAGVEIELREMGGGCEIITTASLKKLRAIMRRVVDGHVMLSTLRPCPFAENSLERDWDIEFEYDLHDDMAHPPKPHVGPLPDNLRDLYDLISAGKLRPSDVPKEHEAKLWREAGRKHNESESERLRGLIEAGRYLAADLAALGEALDAAEAEAAREPASIEHFDGVEAKLAEAAERLAAFERLEREFRAILTDGGLEAAGLFAKAGRLKALFRARQDLASVAAELEAFKAALGRT